MSKRSAKEKPSADSWLMDLDEGIRYAVRVLDRHGVETYESCQGGGDHPANRNGKHAYPVPSVRFHGADGAGWHALGVALDYALPVESLSRIWTFDRSSDTLPHGPYWQMTFYRQVRDENPVVAALERLIHNSKRAAAGERQEQEGTG